MSTSAETPSLEGLLARPHDADPMPSPPGRVRRSRMWSLEHVGVAMAIVVFVCAGTSFALQVPAFHGTDERAHLGYAHAVADGRLPEIEDRSDVPADATQWRASLADAKDDRYRTIWVANHPPLHYLLVAPLVRLATATGRADGGLLFLRLANLAFASVGVVFTYLLTVHATGGSRRLGLAASAIVAVLPRAHYDFSQALNDGLAFAAATAVAWAAARVLRHGHSRTGLVLVAVTAAVATGARAASMIVAVTVVGVLTVARFVTTAGRLGSRVCAAAVTAIVGFGPTVMAFGWFYVRNLSLYGDIGASRYLMERFNRNPSGGFFDILTTGDLWVRKYQALANWSIVSVPVTRPGTTVAAIAGVVAAAGLVISVVSGRTRRRRRWPAPPNVSLAALAACVAVVLAVVTTITQHVSVGGLALTRYTYPALGVLACLFVVGVDAVLTRVLPVVAFVILAAWTAHFLPTRVASEIDRNNGPHPNDLSGGIGLTLLAVSLLSTVTLLAILAWTSVRRSDVSRVRRP